MNLLTTFINAWWLAVNISKQRAFELLMDPTPESFQEMERWRARLKSLQRWASKRWGGDIVGNAIHEREQAK